MPLDEDEMMDVTQKRKGFGTFCSYLYVTQKRLKDYYDVRVTTQDKRWGTHYEELMTFMEREHRRPLKFVDSNRGTGIW